MKDTCAHLAETLELAAERLADMVIAQDTRQRWTRAEWAQATRKVAALVEAARDEVADLMLLVEVGEVGETAGEAMP